jgi:hypothetical protein
MSTTKLKSCLVAALSLLALLFVACNPATTVPSAVEPTPGTELTPALTGSEPQGLLPSDALKRGCQTYNSPPSTKVGLLEGAAAVDFTLEDTSGNTISLSALLSEKPVVMVLGSFT